MGKIHTHKILKRETGRTEKWQNLEQEITACFQFLPLAFKR